MMKKIIIFITLLCTIFSFVPVNAQDKIAAEETESAEYEENIKLLEAIGALSDTDYGKQRILTRAEFAKLITKVVGYNQLFQSEQSKESVIDLSFLTEKGWVYVAPADNADIAALSTGTAFSDVSSDDADLKFIEFVTEAGFMSADNTYFRPYDNVTGHEVLRAMSILLNLGVGQRLSTSEHVQKAISKGLLKKVSEKDMARPLRMKDIAVILLNTLNAEPYIIEFNGINKSCYIKENYLLMNQLYDVYTEKGFVNANEYAALKGYKETVKNFVVIGDTYYKFEDFDIDELLGYKLEIYYKTDDDSDKRIIYYKKETRQNELLIVGAEDIISFENHVFKYLDGSRIKSIPVNSNVSVVYNGASINSYSDHDFVPENGRIVFMKTGNASSYNLAKITKYDTMIVKSVDYQNELVMADVGDIKRFNADDFSEVKFFMPDGTEVVFATISKDVVLNIAQTLPGQKKRCCVVVCNYTVNGRLESIQEAEEKIVIDGSEYKYNSKFVDFKNVPLNTDMTLYTDSMGLVVSYKGKTDSGARYGYLRKVIYDENDENVCYIRIYETDDTFKTYTVSEQIKLNGKRVKAEKIGNYLLDANGVTKYQVIQYWTDNEGKLIEICTADGKEGVFSKYDISALGVSEVTHRNSALLSFANTGFTAFLNAGGYVAFAIPSDKEDDNNYGIITKFANEEKYTFDELYLKSADSRFIDVCVQLDVKVEKSFQTGGATPYMMVSSIECCIDEENEIYYEIEGYNATTTVSYKCYDDELFDVCKELGRGDILRFNLSGTGKDVAWIEKFYDASERRMVNGTTRHGDNLHPNELYSGWAIEATDSEQILLVHKFTYKDGKPDMAASQANYTRDGARMFKYPTRIICYDSAVNCVSLGSKQDVICSKDIETGSTVVIGSHYETAQVMFVIR